ncbi:unnamed protein product [Cochlearia groenlandica]
MQNTYVKRDLSSYYKKNLNLITFTLSSKPPKATMTSDQADDALQPASTNMNNLAIGPSLQSVTFRLMRMWEARNYKNENELMSLELLLLDSFECAVTATIHRIRIPNFIQSMSEGLIYMMTNFEVVQAYDMYKVTDSKHSIRFTDATKIKAVKSDGQHI